MIPGTGDPAPVEAGLARVIHATGRLFTVTGVGLMLVDEGCELRYVGATDAAARALEAAHEDLGEGPCVDCFVTGEPVETADLQADDRWPALSAAVVPAGVRAVLGMPVRLGGAPVGSLNAFHADPFTWDASDTGAIAAFRDVLEEMLGAAVAARRSGAVVRQLETALDRRVTIERAIGILMERHSISAVVAFGALRRAARDERRSVAELAARTLDGEDVVGSRLPRPGSLS